MSTLEAILTAHGGIIVITQYEHADIGIDYEVEMFSGDGYEDIVPGMGICGHGETIELASRRLQTLLDESGAIDKLADETHAGQFGGYIPFATNVEVRDMDGRHLDWAVVCPECGLVIPQRERKDEESHTGREYAEHYTSTHR